MQAIQQKQKYGTFMMMAIFAMLFAYIVVKDVRLSPSIIALFGAIAGIFLIISGMSRPEVVTYALIAYLPFSKELVGDFGGLATALNFTNLLMLFIIFVWVSGRYAKDEPLWLSTPLNLPITLFLVAGFIAVVRGEYFESGFMLHALVEYKRWITPILMFFLVLNTVKEKNTIKNIVLIMATVTTIVGLMAIYEYIDIGRHSSFEKSRVGGIAEQPNMLAAFFNYYMFIPFGFFLMNMKRFAYWGLLIPFFICFRGIMVTFSRGGYLAFALGLYAIIYFRSKLIFAVLLAATFLVVIYPDLLPAGIRYRMGQTFEKQVTYVDSVEELQGGLESSAAGRIEIWKGCLKMIKERPFFGVGYGLFEYTIRYYWSGKSGVDAHNTYLIIAVEMGVPALLIFLWIIWRVFWQTRGLYRDTHDPFTKALCLGFLGGFFGLLMSNMFGSRLDSQEISSYFWILAALMMRLRILDERDREAGIVPETNVNIKTSVQKLDACWVKSSEK